MFEKCRVKGCNHSKQNAPSAKKDSGKKRRRGHRDFCKPHWCYQNQI